MRPKVEDKTRGFSEWDPFQVELDRTALAVVQKVNIAQELGAKVENLYQRTSGSSSTSGSGGYNRGGKKDGSYNTRDDKSSSRAVAVAPLEHSVAATTSKGEEGRRACYMCGRGIHPPESCALRTHPDANRDKSRSYSRSAKGMAWARKLGKDEITRCPIYQTLSGAVFQPPPGNEAGFPPTQAEWDQIVANRKRDDRDRGGKQPSYIVSIAEKSLHTSPTHCLIDVTISPINIRETGPARIASALLDSGARYGSYISVALADWLKGKGSEASACDVVSLCGAFVGQALSSCNETLSVQILLTLDNKSVLNIITDLYITNISFDIILGLPIIREYDLTTKLHSHFANSASQHAVHAIYTKEELLEQLEKEEEEEDAFWKEDITSMLPVNDKATPTQSILDGVVEKLTEFPDRPGLIAVLKKHEAVFSTVVSRTPALVTPMELEINREAWEKSSNRGPPRPQTVQKNQIIGDMLKQLLDADIIQPSQATEYSHVHLAAKPNGKWRFCIDYRALNDALSSLGWPIPHIKRMLQRLGEKRANFFAVLDLTSGYHQVALSETSRPFAAFITEFGVYEPKRISMGLKTAPSYFQQQMALALHGLLYQCCELYIDDIIIFGTSSDIFLSSLDKVLSRLRDKGITLNPDKAQIGLRKLEFVGHEIDHSGLRMSERKVQKVLEFPKPRLGKQLKKFLGLTNYFRDHVVNYSTLTYPLHQLLLEYETVKHKVIQWTETATTAFDQLLVVMGNLPKLYFMDNSADIVLETDASDYGIGAFLYQVVDKVNQPVAFISKSLSKVQQRWSTIEKECYAIWYALRSLEYLLRDVRFTIRTDHKNLRYLNTNSPKVVRWKLAVQEFNFDLEYIEGENNVFADSFSRLCGDVRDDERGDAMVSTLAPIQPTIPVFTIPEDKYLIITQVHNTINGHFGVELTLAKLRKLGHNWTYIREHVREFVRTCPLCQKLSATKLIINTLPFTTSGSYAWERVALDTMGPFPECNGYTHLLVVIDCFSRWVELYPTKSTEATEAANRILELVCRYGTPRQFLHDGGPEFANEIVVNLTFLLGNVEIETEAYSKQENSIVERANKEVLRHLRAFIYDRKVLEGWADHIPLIQRMMNSTTHSSLGVAPYQILFGTALQLDRQIYDTGANIDAQHPQPPASLHRFMDTALARQTRIIELAEAHQKQKDDAHLTSQTNPITEFAVDSLVLCNYPNTAMGARAPSKLHTPLRGPYKVLGNTASTYHLLDLVTNKSIDVHVGLLRPFMHNPTRVDPRQVAQADTQTFTVEGITSHRGNAKKQGTMYFAVKFIGDPQVVWKPYKEVKRLAKLHEYLQTKPNLKQLIPKEYRK